MTKKFMEPKGFATVQKGFATWRTFKGPHPGNTSGFRACGHNLLLLPEQIQETSAGGIVFITKTQEAEKNHQVWATIVEIGPGCWDDQAHDFAEVGDKVLIGQYVGKFHKSEVDGLEYRFIKDMDVITPLVNP